MDRATALLTAATGLILAMALLLIIWRSKAR
jgi:hypothetical protein